MCGSEDECQWPGTSSEPSTDVSAEVALAKELLDAEYDLEAESNTTVPKPMPIPRKRKSGGEHTSGKITEEDDADAPGLSADDTDMFDSVHDVEEIDSDGTDLDDASWNMEFARLRLVANKAEEEAMEEAQREAVSKHVTKNMAAQKAWGEARQILTTCYVRTQAVPVTPVICAKCEENVAILRCLDCTGYSTAEGVPLCATCDIHSHPYAHFHRREHSLDGCWRALPATLQYDPIEKEWIPTRALLDKTKTPCIYLHSQS